MKQSNTPVKNRILIIDDNPSIHEDIRKILCSPEEQPAGLAESKSLLFGDKIAPVCQEEFDIESAFQGEEGLRMVKEAEMAGRPFALAFVDVRMPPGWDGVETIKRIWKEHPCLQVVICTAYSDYSWEQMIRRIGKSDNMVILKKPFDNIEVLQLAHALAEKWRLGNEMRGRLKDLDSLVAQRTCELQSANEKLKREIAERMVLENALRVSEERFSKAFKASPIPLAIQSFPEEYYVNVNKGFSQLTGYEPGELIGRNPHTLGLWADPNEGAAMLRTLREQMSVRNMPCRWKARSGQFLQILLSVEFFELEGKPFVLIVAQDITEQFAQETQLRQAYKMEAVSQLAAGVAHDFNNILTVVQGHVSLMLDAKSPEHKERPSLQTVLAAADRASKLVRQLLAFSRKQVIQMRRMSVQESFASLAETLPRVLGENISVKVGPVAKDLPINADPGMMDQLFMNLAVNARDAMPDGGQLTLNAQAVELTASLIRGNPEARPGSFMRVSVADTGCGIAPEVLPHIFEPFFTTKPVGKGTGLGLAAVFGIAKQHGGWMEVQSQPGKGATFHVFLPTCAALPQATAAPSSKSDLQGGHETILVAEDDNDVRDFVVTVLETYGYKLISASCGAEAIECWTRHNGKIHLLLTDMVMPGGMNGTQLAENLLAKDPSLRVLYTSGYSPGMAGKDITWPADRNFLAKPYDPAVLVRHVRACLDAEKFAN
jgi:PAS domain S-box-containing protein